MIASVFDRLSSFTIFLVLVLLTVECRAGDIYVSPSGLVSNDASRERPITLRRALPSAGPARPGDTVWLLGGNYFGN
jgi:hypothetical protein